MSRQRGDESFRTASVRNSEASAAYPGTIHTLAHSARLTVKSACLYSGEKKILCFNLWSSHWLDDQRLKEFYYSFSFHFQLVCQCVTQDSAAISSAEVFFFSYIFLICNNTVITVFFCFFLIELGCMCWIEPWWNPVERPFALYSNWNTELTHKPL